VRSRLSASSARWRRIGVISAVAVSSAIVLGGCSKDTTEQLKRLGFPSGVSDRAHYVQDLWIGAWIAAGAIGVFVWGLILWSSIRYRRRGSSHVPPQVRYNLPIEMLYTVAPLIVILVLFFYTVKADDNIYRKVKHPDHTITVTAQQWSWTFNYVNDRALDGSTDVFDVGTPAQKPVLWLPKGQTVAFTLHSPDVIHSFWIPAFLFKLDVIPGRQNSFSLTPTKEGTFDGRCAELCGLEHSRMLFTVKIVSPRAYANHLSDLASKGQIGILLGGSNADKPAGLDGSGGRG
jgi:cytochrome c oxidase subunit 2